MPIYNYKCEECGHGFSVRESRPTSASGIKCKAVKGCEGKPIRIPAKSSFALKGAGWFKDGY